MAQAEKHKVREYLLGELSEAEEEEVELRLLTETDFAEDFDIVVNEITDDYIAGKFAGEELRRVEDHFFKSSERRDKLEFALALKKRKSDLGRQRLFRRYLAIAASILVLAGGFYIWRVQSRNAELNKGLAALQSAFRDQRPLEPRISRFDYAPYLTTRGTGPEKIDQDELGLAELTLRTELKKNRTPAALHALGKVFLAKKQFDDAIKQFDEAVKGDPKNAQLYSDLGAALLEKGRADRFRDASGKGFEEFARSLEDLDKAIALDDGLLEALFNRALVHEALALTHQAEEDWKKYLERDGSSKWAEEAREHLRLLAEQNHQTSRTKEQLLQDFLSAYGAGDEGRAWQVISRSREALSRKLIWEQLLDAYLDATKEGRSSDADGKLQALTYEGDLESRRAGDQYVAALAKFYRATSESQRQALMEARSLMKLGHEYYFQQKMDKAEEAYVKARQRFAAAKDDWETQYAQHWIGYSYYEQGKTQEGLAILEELARTLQKENYQWLLMRTLHITSSAYLNLNEYSKAINYNIRALALAERIDDKIGIFNASSILVFQYGSTENHGEAFAQIQRSLSVMNDCALNEIQFARHFGIIALAFDAAGLYHTAIDYQKEALRRAIAIEHAQHTSVDYARLGLMYAKLGDFNEAHRNLDLAYNIAQSDSDEKQRKDMMGFATLQSGHLFREQGDFIKAIRSYDQFIAISDPVNFQFDVYEAHKNRLFCYLAQGSDFAAADELKTTLDLAGKYRSTIVEAENRNDFFDIQQSVYDLAIDFYSRMNEPEKAFQYSEDSRSRSLLDSVIGQTQVSAEEQTPNITFKSVAQPLTLTEIQARLPANAQILQYAVLHDKVMIWVISRNQFLPIERKITQRELEKQVDDYLRIVIEHNGTGNEAVSSAKSLFEILIEPAVNLLDRSKPVYLVPDKFLHSLPFGTLISPATGKFLLEDYRLELSPSSSLLVILSENAGKKEAPRNERLLSVGNPRFDRNDFPSLPDLPSASREAEQVATYYDSPRVLIGPDATLSQVTAEMAGADVIHLALHSLANEQASMRSKLVLAKDPAASSKRPTSDGSLPAYEMYRLKLPRTRLAVLSACETGAEHYYGGEGMISLARPFLAAGVPLVVVSLWPVESNSTAELMISFHKHRKQDNLPSAEALRQAQLDMLKRPEEQFHQPFFWGGFVLIGGSTSF